MPLPKWCRRGAQRRTTCLNGISSGATRIGSLQIWHNNCPSILTLIWASTMPAETCLATACWPHGAATLAPLCALAVQGPLAPCSSTLQCFIVCFCVLPVQTLTNAPNSGNDEDRSSTGRLLRQDHGSLCSSSQGTASAASQPEEAGGYGLREAPHGWRSAAGAAQRQGTRLAPPPPLLAARTRRANTPLLSGV